jgi:putative Ca2+/H+ antiporter (TMEM165/GDT1 family)
MDAFWQSTALIAVAEMGDKSQLAALAFASRFSARVTLAGITAATLLVHLLSVLVDGEERPESSHPRPILYFVAIAAQRPEAEDDERQASRQVDPEGRQRQAHQLATRSLPAAPVQPGQRDC